MDRYLNNSTIRTFTVLEVIGKAGFPLSLSAITEAAELDKTTTKRFLTTLCEIGYVERTSDGLYRLTSKILELSSMYLRNVTLPHRALPFLEQFCQETKTSTSLAVLDGTEAVYVAHISVNKALSVGVRIGSRLPAHATAVGKMLLSFLPDQEIRERFNKEELPVYTSMTTSALTTLLGGLSEIRRQGWAFQDEEYEKGVRGAACPILAEDGTIISAINVSTRTDQISKIEFLTTLVPKLLKTANMISEKLKGDIETKQR